MNGTIINGKRFEGIVSFSSPLRGKSLDEEVVYFKESSLTLWKFEDGHILGAKLDTHQSCEVLGFSSMLNVVKVGFHY